jgi:hypothetical protein
MEGRRCVSDLYEEPRLIGQFRGQNRAMPFIADIYAEASAGSAGEDIQRKFGKALRREDFGLFKAGELKPDVIDDHLFVVARVEEISGHCLV